MNGTQELTVHRQPKREEASLGSVNEKVSVPAPSFTVEWQLSASILEPTPDPASGTGSREGVDARG